MVFNYSNVYSKMAWKDLYAKMLCTKQQTDMFRMIPFCIILYVEEHILKCGGIESWDLRLKFFVFLNLIHVCLLTVNMYNFLSKKKEISKYFPTSFYHYCLHYSHCLELFFLSCLKGVQS